jgi:ADP-heptose:LPS heptosyltransferase
MKRNTAFIINGGAGRVICSIPALEKYAEENPDDDFIIVVEFFIDLFKGHPTLYKRCYDHHHRHLYEDKLKNMNVYFPECYHVWEYYNQQCSISQAFDILINKKGLRDLPVPTLFLGSEESQGGIETVKTVKKDFNNKKAIVFQPFGRGSNMQPGVINNDPQGRSFSMADTVQIIRRLQKKYTVIVMAENQIDFKALGIKEIVPQLTNMSLRRWMGVINAADYFLGCDSVGQHLAVALNRPATVVIGGTYKENVSYPSCKKLKIIDLGEGKRMYAPIRLCSSEIADSNNEKLMTVDDAILTKIMLSVDSNI